MVLRTEDRQRVNVRAWMGWLLKDGKTMVALIGVLIYGVVRIATEAFYDEFNVSPDDLGVGHAQIIGRAALYFVLFLFVVAAAVELPAALALAVKQRVGGRGWRWLSHSHNTANEHAPALWSLAVVIACLPVIFALLSPELTDFLLGYTPRGNGVTRTTLRWSTLAWIAMLGVVINYALSLSCPQWRRRRPTPHLVRWLMVLYLPFALAPLTSILVRQEAQRRKPTAPPATWVEPLQRYVLIGLAAYAALVAVVVLWRGRTGARQAVPSYTPAALAKGLVFYVLLLPIAATIVSQDRVRALLPGHGTFERQFERSYADRWDIVWGTARVVGPWLIALALAIMLAWWLNRRHRSSGGLALEPLAPTMAGVGALALAGAALLVLAQQRGQFQALRVIDGDFQRPALTLLVVHADPVCVTGTGAPEYPGPYMFLGRTSGKLVLFAFRRTVPGSEPPRLAASERTLVLDAGQSYLSYLRADVHDGPDPRTGENERDRAESDCRFRASVDKTTTTTTSTVAKP